MDKHREIILAMFPDLNYPLYVRLADEAGVDPLGTDGYLEIYASIAMENNAEGN